MSIVRIPGVSSGGNQKSMNVGGIEATMRKIYPVRLQTKIARITNWAKAIDTGIERKVLRTRNDNFFFERLGLGLELPPKSEVIDFATACFELSREFNPPDVAEKLDDWQELLTRKATYSLYQGDYFGVLER